MGNDKSPGPDGYTAAFFKDAWEIVGSDVVNAVKEFFVNGKLLKELNHTVIALIPKIQNPTRINDFRPRDKQIPNIQIFIIMANTRRHGYAVSSLMDTAYWSSE
ncbi:hypothetical protein Tco_0695852 [Tanacetum coccineum]